MKQPKIQVFISYAKEDQEHAQKLYQDLQQEDIKPWIDCEDLLPGQKWETTIQQAIQESTKVIVLLSNNALSKRGFVNKEIGIALKQLEQYPSDEIFIIPARLDECEPADERLKELQWTDLFSSYEKGLERILLAIRDEKSDKKEFIKAEPSLKPSVFSAEKNGANQFVEDDNELFNNSAEHIYDLSPTEVDTVNTQNEREFLEGQKLIGSITAIAPNFFEVAIEGYGYATISRPEVDLEICTPEIGDKLALQVREGIPMFQTAAQILPIDGKEYYYGRTVKFHPEYYDPKIGLVVGKVENIRTFARLLTGNANTLIKSLESTILSNLKAQKIPLPLPHDPIPLSVIESVYYEGEWCLLLSSKLQERKSYFIRSIIVEEQRYRLLQRSYMFDYLEYQTKLAGKIEIHNKGAKLVRVEKILPPLQGIYLFPIRIASVDAQYEKSTDVKNFGVIRETGNLALFLDYGNIKDIHPDAFYEAILLAKRGEIYCASLHIEVEDNHKALPVIVNLPESLDIPIFGSPIPFSSFVSITETIWNDTEKVYKSKLVSAFNGSHLQNANMSGWTWYYSKTEKNGQLWGINPALGVWSPLYPYNHLLHRMGLPVNNPQLLKSCEEKFGSSSYYKAEKESQQSIGIAGKGVVTYTNGSYEIGIEEIKLEGKPYSLTWNSEFILDGKGENVEGHIIDIDSYFVYIRTMSGIIGKIPNSEFANLSNYRIGDIVEVFTTYEIDDSGQSILSKKLADSLTNWKKIQAIYENDEIVSGKVLEKVKGGLLVDLLGFKAFMPASQIDFNPIHDYDRDKLIGGHLEFKVQKLNNKTRNIVASRRSILQKELTKKREILINDLKEGQVRTGIVKNIVDYGVFIDLGGLDALLHITDISWGRVNHPSALFSIGDDIPVKILTVDRENGKVSVGMKQCSPDPWSTVVKKYQVGSRVTGKVVSLADYGAFIELGEGIEGLLHISELSWTKRVKHPSKVLSLNGTVESIVLDVDTEKRRIILGLKQLTPNPWIVVAEKYPPGSIINGTVHNLTDFGAFIELEGGVDGLVHISDMSWATRIKHPSEVLKKGEQIQVVLLSIDVEKERLSLGIKQLQPDPWQKIGNSLAVGDKVQGRVARLTDFGAFVQLDNNNGIEGLLHVSELACQHIKRPEDILSIEDEITAKVIKLDIENRRIGLSIKQIYSDSGDAIKEKYPIGINICGKIIEIRYDGILLDVESGLIGFIPKDKLSVTITYPLQNFVIGEEIQAKVINNSEYPIILSIEEYLTEQGEDFKTEWIHVHQIKELPIDIAVVTKFSSNGIYVDYNGREGVITVQGILENFQTALLKVGDVLKVYERQYSSGKLKLGMIPDTHKFWDADVQKKYLVRTQVNCNILKIFSYGIFVELEENVVGLVTREDLIGGNKITKANARYKIGDYIELYITSINPEEQKIFLRTYARTIFNVGYWSS